MAENPTAVVRGVLENGKRFHHLLVWCPGCDLLHRASFAAEGDDTPEPVWTFDGNVESPTVRPSLLVTWTYGPEHKKEDRRCHSYITAGQWQFLDDSTHALKGRTVPLPPVPDWVLRERH